MSETLDTFGRYVRDRLDEWGREFSLARDCEYLGHQSRNMLQVLIEHRGEMPGKTQGYKPLEVSLPALQIEQLVAEIARDQPHIACTLRGYYCGAGRRKVERYETAILLIANVCGPNAKLPNVRMYLQHIEVGTAMIRGALIGIAQAA
jgi:hypothetical protein